MSYTATQTKLIKERVRAYYRATKAKADYRFSWRELSAFISEYTAPVRFRGDSLRQIAEGQISRQKRRTTEYKYLKSLVSFLTHPEINALSLRELAEPDIPYLFAMQLAEFLRLDEDSEVVLPPAALEGVYRAVCQTDDGISDIALEITLSNDRRLLHLEELSVTYRNLEVDPAQLSASDKRRHLWRQHESMGWGIFTPEENMIAFMRRRSLYGGNQFYNLIANIPRISGESPIERLVLHAHDDPYFADISDNDEKWLEEIRRNVTHNNLRDFIRTIKIDKEMEM